MRSEDRSEAGDRRAMGVLVVANAAQRENTAILTFTNYVFLLFGLFGSGTLRVHQLVLVDAVIPFGL